MLAVLAVMASRTTHVPSNVPPPPSPSLQAAAHDSWRGDGAGSAFPWGAGAGGEGPGTANRTGVSALGWGIALGGGAALWGLIWTALR